MALIKIGFPLNKTSAETEKYATISFDGQEVRVAMTGIPAIVAALKSGRNSESLSADVVKDAAIALEEIHERMWKLCDSQGVA